MIDFPEFMKNSKNRISNKEQYTKDIEGYFYNGEDGGQMAFWNIMLTEFPINILMNLTSIWFVSVVNIQYL